MSDAPLATPTRATDLVAFQAGAVVSRTLLKQPGGTLTLFAFDAGQELSEHTAPFDAVVHVLDGRAEVRVGGVPHLVGPGELLRLPAGVPHALRAKERFRMLLAMVRAPA